MTDPVHPTPPDEAGTWQVTRQLPATDSAVRDVLTEIETGLQAAGCHPDCRHATQIVLAEVLNNIVEHAYGPDGDGSIQLGLRFGQGSVTAELRDQGKEMPESGLPGDRFPELDVESLADLPEGGFGWAMVRHLTESLSYVRSRDQNIVSFRVGGAV